MCFLTRLVVPLVLAVLWSTTALPARADEVRDFVVLVDGKAVGFTQMTIANQQDGSNIVNIKADVTVKLLFTYTYSFQGTEVWKNYRLQSLQSQCNDNGKRSTVTARLEADGSAVRVRTNDSEKLLRPDIWTTSYWMLPEARFHNNAVTLLDSDVGKEIQGRLIYIGTEQRTVAGQLQTTYHFRVTGGKMPIDLWFDVQHRLVRQEFVELGHRTIIDLTRVRRD